MARTSTKKDEGKSTRKTPARKASAGKAGGKSRSAAKARTPAPSAAASPKKPASPGHRRELVGVVLVAIGLTLGLAVWSFDPSDDSLVGRGLPPAANLIGSFGHQLADLLLSTLGVGAFVLALVCVGIAALLFSRLRLRITVLEAMGWTTVVLAGAVLAHLLIPETRPFHHVPGGLVGLFGGELLRGQLNTVGAVIVAIALMILALVLAADLRVHAMAGPAVRTLRRLGDGVLVATRTFGERLWEHHLETRAERREARARARARLERMERTAEAVAAAEARAAAAPEDPLAAVVEVPRSDSELANGKKTRGKVKVEAAPPPPPPASPQLAGIAPIEELPAEERDPLCDPNHSDPAWIDSLGEPAPVALPRPQLHVRSPGPVIEGLTPSDPQPILAPEAVAELEPELELEPEVEAEPETPPVELVVAPPPPARPTPKQASEGPTIVEAVQPETPKKRKKQQGAFAFTTHGERFELPDLDLLDEVVEDRKSTLDRDGLHETARKLCQKLADFGISGEVTKIRLGPVVTMYEFVPGPGVKISKIASLSDDLAMAMEALRVRIVAPLPGKGAVGIEVPNKVRQTVQLREILEQPAFQEAKGKLTMGVGKDVEGMPFVADLAKMPHLLVAGTTGSGKSVAVNAMISSILMRATPDDVRFIMVDPKWTELSLYEGIPHLLLPVVKDPAKAALALRWAVEEMDRRYQLLADWGVRGLAGFNREVKKAKSEWEERQQALPKLPDLETMSMLDPRRPEVEEEFKQRLVDDPKPPDHLPLIVIIIDELADLMMVASRDVETYIARIAQKARAAGLHLLVATQRPSTDVLTGLIKVNFPARIGFRVASRHDSQTIINQPGSEKLLGMGDMLIIPPGQADPTRVHGAFVSDDEVKRLVDHLTRQGEPIYDESILKARDEEKGEEGEEEDYDPKWDEAVMVVSEMEKISVSMLQRKMKIGYNRAARMVEQMEREGIVGPADGAKPRDVLISAPPPVTPPPA
ncbi:MAG: DNA translocase FtsK 4TM domain-containing protein [Deltaproteobacteria bacterium]|nr:DNA translocase FtsK 4TM domain-containing protein [Deltaproteobacteria bacterium]